MADFFQEEIKEQEVPETPEKIKIGESEYSQAELERLVGLGKIGAEAEDKYKTRIDRVWPEYTKATQKIQDLETKLAERKTQEIETKIEKKEELSQEEMREMARKQAKELGLVLSEDFDSEYIKRRSAERLLEDVQKIVKEAETLGKPKTSVDAVLQHMQETGMKSPDKAYKDMYETELDAWKLEQSKKVKPNGISTIEGTSAGGKQPAPVKVTKDNLAQLVSEVLSGS
jgi:hypothetical protein